MTRSRLGRGMRVTTHEAGAQPQPRAADRNASLLVELTEDRAEFSSGGEPKLGEHFAEVVFDGPGADEELAADLRVGVSVGGEPGDLRFLRRQVGPLGSGALVGCLSGSEELAIGRARRRPRRPCRGTCRRRLAAARGHRAVAVGAAAIRRTEGEPGPDARRSGCAPAARSPRGRARWQPRRRRAAHVSERGSRGPSRCPRRRSVPGVRAAPRRRRRVWLPAPQPRSARRGRNCGRRVRRLRTNLWRRPAPRHSGRVRCTGWPTCSPTG